MRSVMRIVALLVVAGSVAACSRANGLDDRPGVPGGNSSTSAAASSQAPGKVQTQGTIQAIDGNTWVVGQDLVTLAPNATVVGAPIVGAIVQVGGTRATDGHLVADQATVIQPAQPAAAPQPPPAANPRQISNPRQRRGGDGEGDD